MEPDFWLEKWQRQETGFHLSNPHPLLCKYAERFFESNARVFVPLCGKTYDLIYLVGKGFQVVGNELSPLAIDAFFREQKITPQLNEEPAFMHYLHGNLEVLVGDFFKLKAEDLNSCTSIYDRAALVAMPPNMRIKYVNQMQQLVPSAKLLLVTLDYPQAEMDGPPFSVSQEEVAELFGFADIELAYQQDILEKEPKFKQRGLSYFKESAYVIHW